VALAGDRSSIIHHPSSSRRARLFVVILALACLALFSGARCYPPGTRVIVFVQGIYSTYDAGGTQSTLVEGQRFNTLKAGFVAKGYDRNALLDFSYTGGSVRFDGAWQPKPYSCETTDRTADQNLAVLEQMLRDYKARHHDVHFALVGHSLGGYLAFLEGAREAGRDDAAKLGIDVVVTLDAPLEGVSADKKTIIDLIPCDKTYIAGAEIVEQKFDPNIRDERSAQAAAMALQGIRLATMGNEADCLWNTGHCLPGGGWVDDSATQFVDGAAFQGVYQVEAAPLLSHDAMLADGGVVRDVVSFVGAP
jgi:hypothetical protein